MVRRCSSQDFAAADIAPPLQFSPVVQALPSSQAAVCPRWSSLGRVAAVRGAGVAVVTGQLRASAFPVSAGVLVGAGVTVIARQRVRRALASAGVVAGLGGAGLLSSHGAGLPAVQTPSLQASSVVQLLPSSQGFVLFAWTQPVLLSQPAVVQGLPSSHETAAPLQVPLAQVSFSVQASPSLQEPVLTTLSQPFTGSQLSVVQGLPSSQTTAAPPTQAPSLRCHRRCRRCCPNRLAWCCCKRSPSLAAAVGGAGVAVITRRRRAAALPPAQVFLSVQLLPSSQAPVLAALVQPAPLCCPWCMVVVITVDRRPSLA